MSASNQVRDGYSEAFAFRGRMHAFLADLGEGRGWTVAARLLEVRFAAALTAFLDAPTRSRLVAMLALEADIARVDSLLKGVRPGLRAGARRIPLVP